MTRQEIRFVIACMALITAIFLSSGVAGAHGGPINTDVLRQHRHSNPFSGARSFVVELDAEADFEQNEAPVPYPRLDTSRLLDPWYRIYKLTMLRSQMDDFDKIMARWPANNPSYDYVAIGIFAVAAVLFGVMVVLDGRTVYLYYRRKRNNKRIDLP